MPGDDLTVVERGKGAPLVVFVHGVLDRGRSFAPVADLLERECRMILYDRRGYGDSLGAAGAPVDVHAHVDDLIRILGGQRAVLVGHSFGGVTALGAALRAPGLVSAVALYETAMAWVPGWNDDRMRKMLCGNDPETAGVRMMLGERFDNMAPEERVPWLLQGAAFITEERSVRIGAAPFDIATLEAPIVYAHENHANYGVVGRYLVHTVRHAEVVELRGGGHNAHRSQPAAFADFVRRGIALASRHDERPAHDNSGDRAARSAVTC